MLSTFSSNAILSKALAMYGKRLREKDYKNLAHCGSVGEAASYLKYNTAYGPELSGLNEKEVHRRQLEMLLRQKLFFDFAALCRYELSVGEHFSEYLLARSETEQILHSLMLLMGQKSSDYLFEMPLFLNSHTRIDLTLLPKIKNFDDFLLALKGTPYLNLIAPFRPLPGKPLDMAGIDNALHNFLYRKAFTVIEKYSRGNARKELHYLFSSFIDYSNYVRIVRLKRYYDMEPNRIRPLLTPNGSLSKRQLDALLSSSTELELHDAIYSTPAGKRIKKLSSQNVDEIPMRIRYSDCKRLIRFSVHPPVVMLAYIFLTEIELYNITNIIEGIRYQIPEEKILGMLIYSNS